MHITNDCAQIKHKSQNLNWWFATFIYSGFENLYFKILMNFGLISFTNNLTSFMTSLRSLSEYVVNFSISLFQASIFLSYLQLKIKQAAAILDGLNFRKAASSKQISKMYCE